MSLFKVYREVHLLLSLVLTCPNHCEYGGVGLGTQDFTVKPFGGVVGLIQRNIDKGGCPLDNPSERLTEASLLLMLLSIVKYQCVGCLLL